MSRKWFRWREESHGVTVIQRRSHGLVDAKICTLQLTIRRACRSRAWGRKEKQWVGCSVERVKVHPSLMSTALRKEKKRDKGHVVLVALLVLGKFR